MEAKSWDDNLKMLQKAMDEEYLTFLRMRMKYQLPVSMKITQRRGSCNQGSGARSFHYHCQLLPAKDKKNCRMQLIEWASATAVAFRPKVKPKAKMVGLQLDSQVIPLIPARPESADIKLQPWSEEQFPLPHDIID